MSRENTAFVRAVALGVNDLVAAALWVAAIDTLPVEERAETVERWMRAVDALDLWRLIAEIETGREPSGLDRRSDS